MGGGIKPSGVKRPLVSGGNSDSRMGSNVLIELKMLNPDLMTESLP